MDSLNSNLGLLLCLAPALVHGLELISPMLSRLVVNFVLPFFQPRLPSKAESLSYDEQLVMLDAARDAAPSGKGVSGASYIFLLLFEQRQGGIAFVSMAVGIVYALGLPVAERTPLHLVFAVMAVLFTLVNANHAGIPGLGHHPRIAPRGRNVGILFAPFWGLAAALNIMAFLEASG